MPTVICDKTDCTKHGIEVCTANRVIIEDGEYVCYEPISHLMTQGQSRKSGCHREQGKYVSDRVTGRLK